MPSASGAVASVRQKVKLGRGRHIRTDSRGNVPRRLDLSLGRPHRVDPVARRPSELEHGAARRPPGASGPDRYFRIGWRRGVVAAGRGWAGSALARVGLLNLVNAARKAFVFGAVVVSAGGGRGRRSPAAWAGGGSVPGGGRMFWAGEFGARGDGGGLQLFLRRPGGCGRPRSSAPPGRRAGSD